MLKLLAVAVVALAVAPWGSNCEAHVGLEQSPELQVLQGGSLTPEEGASFGRKLKQRPGTFGRKLKGQEQSLVGRMTPELQFLQGGSLTPEEGASFGRKLKQRPGTLGRKLKGGKGRRLKLQRGAGSNRKLKVAGRYGGGRRLASGYGAGRRLNYRGRRLSGGVAGRGEGRRLRAKRGLKGGLPSGIPG